MKKKLNKKILADNASWTFDNDVWKNFDNHMIGDLNQRIIDNERIECLITSESITTFFSIFSFSV